MKSSACRLVLIATSVFSIGHWVPVPQVKGDAIVTNKSMAAEAIAEIFVDSSKVRVEFEIGPSAFRAFRNILPDPLFDRLIGDGQTLATRLPRFLKEDFRVMDGDRLLEGKIVQVTPSRRIARDEITGEPLSDQPAEAEIVIRLSVEFVLPKKPEALTFLLDLPQLTNVGFVCYHNQIMVNDFRYLPAKAQLQLDWDDPWYSKFDHPNLGRQFDAPISVFLYVEDFEVRKETIFRVKEMQQWLDLKLPANGRIPVEDQKQLKRQISDFLATKNLVSIDGTQSKGFVDRIHFVERNLRTTGIIDPPIELDSNSATLGVIEVYPVEQLPESVTMNWELFSEKIKTVPAATSDEAGSLPGQVSESQPKLEWKNYLQSPTRAEIKAIQPQRESSKVQVPILSTVLIALALGISGWLWYQHKPFTWATSIISLGAIGLALFIPSQPRLEFSLPLKRTATLSEQDANQILTQLLANVYSSFDHHHDEVIYDRLAKSISGEVLSEIFLETKASMEIKNQGGLRISIKEVKPESIWVLDESSDEPGFQFRWRVSGWIGHWGHVHSRENEQMAKIRIGIRDDCWKIVEFDVLEQAGAEQPSGKVP